MEDTVNKENINMTLSRFYLWWYLLLAANINPSARSRKDKSTKFPQIQDRTKHRSHSIKSRGSGKF